MQCRPENVKTYGCAELGGQNALLTLDVAERRCGQLRRALDGELEAGRAGDEDQPQKRHLSSRGLGRG